MANKDLTVAQLNGRMVLCFFVGLILFCTGMPAGIAAYLLFYGKIELPKELPFELGSLNDDSGGNIPLLIISILAVFLICVGLIVLGQSAHYYRLKKYSKKQAQKDKTTSVVSEL
jgi:hypothetical protein